MQIRRFSDPVSFLDRAEPFLMRDEAENNMILGIRGLPGARPPGFREDCYLAVVEDGEEIAACGVRTPPFGVVITRAEAPAVACLAEDLAVKYETLPGVLGPEPAVSTFADLWSRRAGIGWRPLMRMRLFVAHEVRRLSTQPPGGLRFALESDLPIVTPWAVAFHQEARTGMPFDPARTVRKDVIDRHLVVWDDRGPVSMATWAGRTHRSVRIGIAYTPPERRGRGYASACVAALTERLLDDGVAFCCISTDVTNPTTNRIYPAIGYRPVCDISHLAFQAD
jgi:GNAT superfamily N-acetyltransferase